VKTLTGRHNALTAELLAHLAEVDARGIYRERACSSLHTYCVYELRLSEDEAQRRVRAARTARALPVLFEMLAEGAIHLTGLLLLAPLLTLENHAELLARARFRTKREIERLVAEIAPRPDVPARIEPLGPRPRATSNLWQAYMASLRGPVRELVPGVRRGEAPPAVFEGGAGADPEDAGELGGLSSSSAETVAEGEGLVAESCVGAGEGVSEEKAVVLGSPAPARVDAPLSNAPKPVAPLRYHVQFTASERYVELLEEARNLLQHQVPDRDVARVHELAMATFVEQLRKRRQAASDRPRRVAGSELAESDGSAPERVAGVESQGSARARVGRRGRHVPAEVRRAVWERDGAQCTFEDSGGRRCGERAGLEIHHEHAFALGGATTLENLRLMCRTHNGLFAERDFGREHVERMRRSHRDGAAVG
jgi:5-methylcytosine-specific restriction endonuclease McrA